VKRLLIWLDDRTGHRTILHHLLDEKLPPGTGWWFTLGSVLLATLGVQFVTGVALALFYAPTPDHAWDSVRYITTQVRAGSFLRGLHHWGSSIIVVAAVLHMSRVVFFGSYRKPRELNWIVGLILLQLILALGLTGYLLPWDQRAYWATVVTINISALAPVIGDAIAGLLRGGDTIGALTLTRWYAMHVLVLPSLLALLTLVHLYLMRRQGISGPVTEQPGESRAFFPEQAARDLTMAIAVGVLMAALAWQGAPALEAPADPAANNYVPRPDWYFLGLFQLLKYFPGKLEVIGALVLPGVVLTLLAALPWLDRGRSRRWRDRPIVIAAFIGGLAGAVTLTILGAMDKPAAGPAAAWTFQEQAGALIVTTGERCTRCHNPSSSVARPIEPGAIRQTDNWIAAHVLDPEVIAPGVRQPPATNQQSTRAIMAALARLRLGPAPSLTALGLNEHDGPAMILINRECLSCHKIDGAGGTEGPDLSAIGRKLDAATIEKRIIDPTSVQPDAMMPPLGDVLSPEEIASIARFLAKKK
jgi:ubiquinol-cytochrome c reductase cytochrome b subunit